MIEKLMENLGISKTAIFAELSPECMSNYENILIAEDVEELENSLEIRDLGLADVLDSIGGYCHDFKIKKPAEYRVIDNKIEALYSRPLK